VIEQSVRNKVGFFINFNGTAGIWKKACILDAGNWQTDTLTEDLDLSYRAQLRGWKFTYLNDVTSPAELPSEINALKSQQFRWTKGAIETARKMLPSVWKSSRSRSRSMNIPSDEQPGVSVHHSGKSECAVFITCGARRLFHIHVGARLCLIGSFLFYLFSLGCMRTGGRIVRSRLHGGA
jgi:hypothetical protein